MSKRRRYQDTRRAKARAEIRPIEGESPKERHKRRLAHNLENRESAIRWCKERGVRLTITNNGHHWRFERGGELVEWWPSSAKLVFNKRWKQGVHAHDWNQVRAEISGVFEMETVDDDFGAGVW